MKITFGASKCMLFVFCLCLSKRKIVNKLFKAILIHLWAEIFKRHWAARMHSYEELKFACPIKDDQSGHSYWQESRT